MDCLLALWPLLLLVSLVTCKTWSFDLYLKKLPCNMVYIITQNSIKHPCSSRLGSPCPSFSLSLSLYFWLIPWSTKGGYITQGILASFLLSLSYRQLWTTRFQSIKGPQQLTLPGTFNFYTINFLTTPGGASDKEPTWQCRRLGR